MLDDIIFALVAGTAEEALTDAMWEKRGRDARADVIVYGFAVTGHASVQSIAQGWALVVAWAFAVASVLATGLCVILTDRRAALIWAGVAILLVVVAVGGSLALAR